MPAFSFRFPGRALIVLSALGLLLASSDAQARTRRVLVMPLENLGVDEDVAASLLGFLRAEVARLPKVALVDPARAGRPVGGECRGDRKCMAAAGARLKADEVVFGTVAGVGDSYSIDLKLIRVRDAREADRITETISGERELLIDGIRGAAYKLLLPSQYVGRIQVELPEKGAEVFVDGRLVGKSPLGAPIPNLTPGKHALKIVMAGYADFDRWVDVRFARISVVKVDLKNSTIAGVMYESQPVEVAPLVEPDDEARATLDVAATAPASSPGGREAGPGMPAMRLAALGLGGAGVVALAGGALFAAKWSSARSEAQALAGETGVPRGQVAEAQQLVGQVEDNAARANTLFVAGGVAAAGAAALWLLGAPAELTPSVTPTGDGALVSLSGTF